MEAYFAKIYLIIMIAQILIYALLDFLKVKHFKKMTLGMFLSFYVLILPNLYQMPEDTGRLICYDSLPFEIASVEWLTGVALLFLNHLIYYFIQRDNKKTIT